MLKSLLIDTGAFITLADTGDRLHKPAEIFLRALPRHSPLHHSSNHSRNVHLFTLQPREDGSPPLARLLENATGTGHLGVLYSTPEEANAVAVILRRFSDQSLSYADAISSVVAGKQAIGAFFSSDHHLALTGIPVPPGPWKS